VACAERLVVIAVEGFLDDGCIYAYRCALAWDFVRVGRGIYLTKAIHCNAGVIDYKIYATLPMLLLQFLRKRLDAPSISHVQRMESDFAQSAISSERLSLLELRIFFEGFDGGLAPFRGARGEVDQEGAGVQRRVGILESELTDDTETDTLRVVRSWVRRNAGRAGTPCLRRLPRQLCCMRPLGIMRIRIWAVGQGPSYHEYAAV
jgi:hypothetical protein